jgi:hypothetical protein
MEGGPRRAVAVDWSGRKEDARKAIAIAECSADGFRLHGKGRDRDEAVGFLIAEAQDDPDLVVGLDFAFSAPAWFVEEQGAASGPEFWRVVEERGEEWLAGSEPPFFGRRDTRRPADVPLHRKSEESLPGLSPKSFFQTGGAGAVGTMSIRGIPKLAELAEAGFRVWPFHRPEPGRPTVVEIYPRAMTGITGKRSPDACLEVLEQRFGDVIEPGLREQIAVDEDLFDASVSAVVMWRHIGEFTNLPDGDQVEGQIWLPGLARKP